MSKTGEQIVKTIEEIEKNTGYPFKFLMERYLVIAEEIDRIDGHDDPMDVLVRKAGMGEWAMPRENEEVKDISGKVGRVSVKINVDTTELDEAVIKLRHIGRMAARLRNHISDAEAKNTTTCEQPAATTTFDSLTGRISYIDAETAKIRKHNHDTLWAVLAGFTACAVLVIVFGLIIIGILSYARG